MMVNLYKNGNAGSGECEVRRFGKGETVGWNYGFIVYSFCQ